MSLAYDTAIQHLPSTTNERSVGYPLEHYWVSDFETDIAELGLRAFAFEVQENDLWWPHFTERYWRDIPEEKALCTRCGGSGVEPTHSNTATPEER